MTGSQVTGSHVTVVEQAVDAVALAPLRHAARILFAAGEPSHRIDDPAGVHPVFADDGVRRAVVDRVRGVVDAAADLVVAAEWLERAEPDGVAGPAPPAPVVAGVARRFRCWLALVAVDDAPGATSLAPGDLVVESAGEPLTWPTRVSASRVLLGFDLVFDHDGADAAASSRADGLTDSSG